MLEWPNNRQIALNAGLSYYFTGKPCIHGHISKRDAKDRKCIECELAFVRKRVKCPIYKAKFLAWSRANKGKRRVSSKKSKLKNHATTVAAMHKWHLKNKEYANAKSRAWSAANRSRVYALNAERRGRELMATPPWAHLHRQEFEAIYAERERITSETGILHHVDHIYPLKGKNSCGLHVPWNLRVIPAKENLEKRNRPPEDIIMLQMESGFRCHSADSKNSAVPAG